MSENPVVEIMRVFFAGAGFQEVPPTRTYTRDDLIRAVVGQQWAVAIALLRNLRGDGRVNLWPEVALDVADLPCAVDVVDGLG